LRGQIIVVDTTLKCETCYQISNPVESLVSLAPVFKLKYQPRRRTRRGVGGGRPPPQSWKCSGQTLFSGQAQVAQKSWMVKNISIQWKISRESLFFRASTSCSKCLNGKKINIQYIEKIQGTLYFSGQAQVAQKSW